MTLDAIQTRLKEIVATAPSLAGRPVLIEDKGNLVNELETTLQTMSLAVVVALTSGEAKSDLRKSRVAWDESFEVVIHRGQLDGENVPASLNVLEEVREKIQGAPLDPDKPSGNSFTCRRHDLRDGGDGTYARVLVVGLIQPVQ